VPKGSKRLQTLKEAEQADLGGIESPKLGSANAEASETQRRIQWATDLAELAQLYFFFTRLWRGYLTTCLFCLGHVCKKFGARTDWWNCGLILFFFSCPR